MTDLDIRQITAQLDAIAEEQRAQGVRVSRIETALLGDMQPGSTPGVVFRVPELDARLKLVEQRNEFQQRQMWLLFAGLVVTVLGGILATLFAS